MVSEPRFDAILLLGPTAAGKTPLGDTLSSKGINGRQCVHFDFGSELRTIADSNERAYQFTARELHVIRGVLSEGLLLEDEQFYLAKKIFLAFVDRERASEEDVVILNGLPRHIGQADGMRDLVDMHSVLVLTCSSDNVLCRIDDNTGGDRSARKDDHHELVMKKIDVYKKRTVPLIEYYRSHGARLIHIEATPASDPLSMYHDFMLKFSNPNLSIS